MIGVIKLLLDFSTSFEEFLDNLSDDDYYFSRHDDEEYKIQWFNNNDEKRYLENDIVVDWSIDCAADCDNYQKQAPWWRLFNQITILLLLR